MAMAYLRAHGHGADEVWQMTPRQTFAWRWFHEANSRAEKQVQLAIATLGARGDEKAVKDQFRRWED
jgi:hypothetical protein